MNKKCLATLTFFATRYAAIYSFLWALAARSTLAVSSITALAYTETAVSSSTLVTTLTVRATVTVSCTGKKNKQKLSVYFENQLSQLARK